MSTIQNVCAEIFHFLYFGVTANNFLTLQKYFLQKTFDPQKNVDQKLRLSSIFRKLRSSSIHKKIKGFFHFWKNWGCLLFSKNWGSLPFSKKITLFSIFHLVGLNTKIRSLGCLLQNLGVLHLKKIITSFI